MAKTPNRPNELQAQEFDRYIKEWQKVLNLGDWRIERGKKPAANGAMADVECEAAPHLAVYRLGDFGGEEITSDLLNRTALHECLHVFLFDLLIVVRDQLSTESQLEVAEHRVINVLERVLSGEQNASSQSQ